MGFPYLNNCSTIAVDIDTRDRIGSLAYERAKRNNASTKKGAVYLEYFQDNNEERAVSEQRWQPVITVKES